MRATNTYRANGAKPTPLAVLGRISGSPAVAKAQRRARREAEQAAYEARKAAVDLAKRHAPASDPGEAVGLSGDLAATPVPATAPVGSPDAAVAADEAHAEAMVVVEAQHSDGQDAPAWGTQAETVAAMRAADAADADAKRRAKLDARNAASRLRRVKAAAASVGVLGGL